MYYEMLQDIVSSGMTKYDGMEKKAFLNSATKNSLIRAMMKGPQAKMLQSRLLQANKVMARQNSVLPKGKEVFPYLNRQPLKSPMESFSSGKYVNHPLAALGATAAGLTGAGLAGAAAISNPLRGLPKD